MQDRCGAKTRAGTPCRNGGMENGRCRMHGGTNPGAPIQHGRYSFKHRQSLNEKVNKFLQDPEPGNLLAELAILRALLQDYLDRLVEGLPFNLKSMVHIQDFIESIGRMVERISRILNATALTQAEIMFLRARIIDLIDKHIDDDQKRLDFVNDLRYAIEGNNRTITGKLSTPTATITVAEVVEVSE